MADCQLSERECLDVAHLLQYAAERQDIPPECSVLMKRGGSLLIRLSAYCTMMAALVSKNEKIKKSKGRKEG